MERVEALLETGHTWVVDADIKGYFDSIPQDQLLARVREKIADGRILALLEKFLRQGVMDTASGWQPTENGTPQGAVISPLLANIYLNPLDHLMSKLGHEMVRYADDMVILCPSAEAAETVLQTLREWSAQAGLTLDAGARYATGRLALVIPKNSTLPLSQGLAAVVRALKPDDKFAMANPKLAPYGLAAEQALQRSGVGSLPERQKVLGEHIGQATQFVATGAAQAGITALALTQAPEIADRLQVLPLSETLHAPLHQRMVLLRGAGPAAVAWQRFLLSPQAQAVWVRHGYGLPP